MSRRRSVGCTPDRSRENLHNETNTTLRDVALRIVRQTDPRALRRLGLEGGEDLRAGERELHQHDLAGPSTPGGSEAAATQAASTVS